jgi:hypothetical protein
MTAAVDYIRGRVTFGEMCNLPNRYSHHLYRDNYLRAFKAEKNPEGQEAKQLQSEAMAAAFTGAL